MSGLLKILDTENRKKLGTIIYRCPAALEPRLRFAAKSTGQTKAAIIKIAVGEYMRENPLKPVADVPPESVIPSISQSSPDAMVYTVPVLSVKIISNQDGDGWRGVVYDPRKSGTLSTWNSENFNPPTWAKTDTLLKNMVAIASRIDDGGLSHFRVNGTRYVVSSKFETGRWNGGFIYDTVKKKKQAWIRKGEYSLMLNADGTTGEMNFSPVLRKFLNMICGARRAAEVELHKDIE